LTRIATTENASLCTPTGRATQIGAMRKRTGPIINAKNKVRITGWLMWDYEHKEQLGNTRRTLWEVHPIHSIQVLSGSRWVTL